MQTDTKLNVGNIQIEPGFSSEIKHASCSVVYAPGVLPCKALCGVEILNPPSPTSSKCIVCLDLWGVYPCAICGGDHSK